MEEGLLFRQIRCTALQTLVILLLTCQHNPLRNTSSLKDLCQPALSFLLLSQFLTLYSYYFKNGKPFSNILFQPNPVHTSTSYFLKIHRNSYCCTVCDLRRSIETLYSYLRLILRSGIFPSGFHTKIPNMLLPFPYALHDPHISFFSIL